jgi:hypothetical protein
MIEFKTPQTSDLQWVSELLSQSDFYGCEYTFGNTYMWSPVYDIKIARYKDWYLVKNRFGYLFPKGSGDIHEVIGILREQNPCLCFTNADCESLELLRCYDIEITTNRDFYDYVYESDTLINLCGKKLHSKRNHLNRFYESDWSFEPITPENIEEVTAMHNQWCDEKQIYCDHDKLTEASAVVRGLESFFELGFVGGIIRVGGDIQAYTFGEPANNCENDMFVVHVEKAFTRVQGTYAAINREFVSRFCSDYRYINREEDMGADNLRKAKESYCPAFLVEKYKVRFL